MADPSASVNSKKHGRLNEYFAVVELEQNPLVPASEKKHAGSGPRSLYSNLGSWSSLNSLCCMHPMQARYRTRIASRFPLSDHHDNHFPANLALFCFPGGAVLKTNMSSPIFFTFVHTRGNGDRMYGFCLIFYEELKAKARADLQYAIDLHDYADNAAAEGSPSRRPSLLERRFNLFDASECKLSSDSKVYAPICLCLLSCWPYFQQYREWLTGLYRLSLSNTPIPLERYICNFMLEVPNAQAGEVHVQYKMGDGLMISFSCPPPTNPTAWPTLPFEALFNCLDLNNILAFFTAIVLERSIIIKSYYYYLLTACAEVMMALIFPLVWTHVYIPVLPEFLLGVLGAPMPYLVGVHSSFLRTDDSQDLDNNSIDFRDSPPLLALPRKRRGKLIAALSRVADFSKLHSSSSPLRESMLAESDSAFAMPLRPCDVSLRPGGSDEIELVPKWERVTKAFMSLFVTFLGGYRRWLVFPTEKNPSPTHMFRKKGFIEDKKSDYRPFVAALLDTQAFHNFVVARAHPEGDDLDVILFDAAIDEKFGDHSQQRSMFRRREKNFYPHIQTNFNEAKTVVALPPDTSALDELISKNSSENGSTDSNESNVNRFPELQAELYSIPRIIALTKPECRNKFVITHSRKMEMNRFSLGSLMSRFINNGHDSDEQQNEGSSSSFRPQLASVDSTVLSIFMIGSMATVCKMPRRNMEGIQSNPNNSMPPGELLLQDSPTQTEERQHSINKILNGSDQTSGQINIHAPNTDDELKKNQKTTHGGEGGKLNPSRLFCFASTCMIYGEYCSMLLELMNQEGKMQLDRLTVLQRAVCGWFSQKCGKHISQETLMSTSIFDTEPDCDDGTLVSSSSVVSTDMWKDELINAGQSILELTFAMLKFYRNLGIYVDKAVYLTIANAAGECGTSEEAIAIVEMMMEDGIMPDAETNRCLLVACANDPDFDAMHAFDVLDWGKYRNPDFTAPSSDRHRENNKSRGAIRRFFENRINSPNASQGTPDSLLHNSRTGNSNYSPLFGRKTYSSEELQFSLPDTYKLHLESSRVFLQYVFPDLEIDADGETCPQCGCAMLCSDICDGWEPDVNVYTTRCPGKQRNTATTTLQQPTCGKRFVAKFKVMCSDPGWIGSTGVRSPLYCEFLSPWVLHKELTTILESGSSLFLSPAMTMNDIYGTNAMVPFSSNCVNVDDMGQNF